MNSTAVGLVVQTIPQTDYAAMILAGAALVLAGYAVLKSRKTEVSDSNRPNPIPNEPEV